MFPRVLPAVPRAPEDGGAGAPPQSDNAAPPGASPGAGASPPADINIFDAAGDDPPKTPDGKPARPEHIPEQFWDAEKGEARLEQLAKSWSDLRTKVARGEGKIPDRPEGYTLPQVEGLPGDLVKADDPLWVAVRAEAHKAGVTETQLHALLKPYLAAAAKARPPAPDAAAEAAARKAAVQEELAKLGPAGTQLVRDVGGWIAGMVARGALTQAQAQALKAVGSAEGVRALAKLREATGAPAIPTEAMAADAMTEADARKMLREGHATRDAAKVEKATEALRTLERQGKLRAT